MEKIRDGPELETLVIEKGEVEVSLTKDGRLEVFEGKATLIIKNDMRVSETIMQPDILIANEFWDRVKAQHSLSPEKMLMLSALEDAVNHYQKYYKVSGGPHKKCFDEAEAWILSEDGKDFFSFVNICEVLGLDPSYIRSGLLKWRDDVINGRLKDLTGRYHLKIRNQ